MEKRKLNKGEWSEPFALFHIINSSKLVLGNKDLVPTGKILKVDKIKTSDASSIIDLKDNKNIEIINKLENTKVLLNKNKIINTSLINELFAEIQKGSGSSFHAEKITNLLEKIGLSNFKGGSSKTKSDIILDINTGNYSILDEGFSIKSFIGNPPTLLNASKDNTNLIFSIEGCNDILMEKTNNIISKKDFKKLIKLNALPSDYMISNQKICDRLKFLIKNKCNIKFYKAATNCLDHNLKMVDSNMTEILSRVLLDYYLFGKPKLIDRINLSQENGSFSSFNYTDLDQIFTCFKRLLIGFQFGIFQKTKWDGQMEANGMVVITNTGEHISFHKIDEYNLGEYLLNSIKFDKPSTSRHQFASVYKDGSDYLIKLNIQLRFY